MMMSKFEKLTYERRGATAQACGQLYESKVLALVYFRLIQQFKANKIRWFYIGTNVSGVGNFDDVVIRIIHNDGSIEFIFVQAKHRQNLTSYVTFSTINEVKGEFSLYANFKSYLDLQRKFISPGNDEFFKVDGNLKVKIKFILFSSVLVQILHPDKDKCEECVADVTDVLRTVDDGKIINFKKYSSDLSSNIVAKLVEQSKQQLTDMYGENTETFKRTAEDFLERFWFYSGQAKQDKVGEILQQEIFSADKICNDQLLFDEFHLNLQNYWIDDQKNVMFLDPNFDVLEQTKNFITLCNLSQMFVTKVDQPGLEFRNDSISADLMQILQNDGEGVFNTFSKVPWLTGMKFAQYINKTGLKSYCFVNLETVGRNFDVYSAFDKANQFDKLIVVCNGTNDCTPGNLSTKKVIIVSNRIKPNSIPDSRINLDDLSYDSQRCLLDRMEITCRGNTMKLIDVLGSDDFCHNLKRSIDSGILFKFINNEPIEILLTKRCNVLKEVKCFIKREIIQQRIDKSKLIDYCKDYPHLICKVEKFERNLRQRALVVISETRHLFLQFCQHYEDRTVHWVSETNNGLIWQESYGQISDEDDDDDFIVRPGQPESLPSLKDILFKTTVEVGSVNDLERRVTILAAEPGSGKSTLMTKFVEDFSQRKAVSIIRINLLEYYSYFKEIKGKTINLQTALQFLLQNGFQTQCSVQLGTQENLSIFPCNVESLCGLTLLKTAIFVSLYNGKNLSVLVDGFDEIWPKYGTEVLSFLNALKNSHIRKLVVTTRSNSAQTELQKRLNESIQSLEPFNENQVQEYFLKRWGTSSDITNFEKVEIFVAALISYFSKVVSNNSNFLGIPLQADMVATCYEESFQLFCNDQTDKPASAYIEHEKLDLVSLYDKFYDIKRQIYLKDKCGINPDHPYFEDHDNSVEFEAKHRRFALVTLFGENSLEKLLSPQERSKYLNDLKHSNEKEGIVWELINGKPLFVHLSYAECYAAKVVFEKIISLSFNEFTSFWSTFIAQNLIAIDRQQICKFIQTLALRSSPEISNLPSIALYILETSSTFDLDKLSFQYLLAFVERAMPIGNCSQNVMKFLQKHDEQKKMRFFTAFVKMHYFHLVRLFRTLVKNTYLEHRVNFLIRAEWKDFNRISSG